MYAYLEVDDVRVDDSIAIDLCYLLDFNPALTRFKEWSKEREMNHEMVQSQERVRVRDVLQSPSRPPSIRILFINEAPSNNKD